MIDIRSIRAAAEMTQTDIARGLGFSGETARATVSQIESRTDWLLSSLSNYIRAAGGTGELVVQVNGQELRFEL